MSLPLYPVSREFQGGSKAGSKRNMNPVQKAVANIAEIFAPLIPAIIVGGLILGFRNIIGEIPVYERRDRDAD